MSNLKGIINCLKVSLNISTIICGSDVGELVKKIDDFNPVLNVKICEKYLIGKVCDLMVIIDFELDDNDARLYDDNGNALLDLSTHDIIL